MSKLLCSLFTFSALLLVVAACSDTQSGQRTNWGTADGNDTETQLSTESCSALRANVESTLAAINSCQSNFDCALTSGIRRAGYACKEVGYNRAAATQPFNDALNAYYKGCGRFINRTCNDSSISTNQPCQAGRCVRNIDQIVQ